MKYNPPEIMNYYIFILPYICDKFRHYKKSGNELLHFQTFT